ncbi:MAG: CIA30 family protein [Lentisphaeria bacterium]|nr:CIA30 family protein [Lentisphaeria bacterium]
MKARTIPGTMMAGFALCGALWSAEPASLPVCCAVDFGKLEPVAMSGVTTQLTRMAPDQGGSALRVAFRKSGDERRFLALQTQPTTPLGAFKALDVSCRIQAPDPLVLRPAVLLYENGGGAWFRSGRPVAPTGDFRGFRMPLMGMRQTAFSADASGELEWDKVDRIWVGFVADGAGEGAFEIAKLVLTSEAYRPTEAVPIFRPQPSAWHVSADPAVKSRMAAAEADGVACLASTFTFPGGRHMYFVPNQSVEEMEYSAYEGLRFTYKARVPDGINGLLVSVHENGGQFHIDPPPTASGEWTTIVVPWSRFKLGGWSRDDNDRLDPDAIRQISFGVHGTAAGTGGEGEIVLKAVEVVPPQP